MTTTNNFEDYPNLQHPKRGVRVEQRKALSNNESAWNEQMRHVPKDVPKASSRVTTNQKGKRPRPPIPRQSQPGPKIRRVIEATWHINSSRFVIQFGPKGRTMVELPPPETYRPFKNRVALQNKFWTSPLGLYGGSHEEDLKLQIPIAICEPGRVTWSYPKRKTRNSQDSSVTMSTPCPCFARHVDIAKAVEKNIETSSGLSHDKDVATMMVDTPSGRMNQYDTIWKYVRQRKNVLPLTTHQLAFIEGLETNPST